MKRLFICFISFIVIFSACDNAPKYSLEDTSDESYRLAGVELFVEAVTPKDLSFYFENTTEDEYIYGEPYALYVRKNNDWEPVELIIEPLEFEFTLVAYFLTPHSITEARTVNWEWAHGELSGGDYKFQKEILFIREAGNHDRYLLEREFSLP